MEERRKNLALNEPSRTSQLEMDEDDNEDMDH